MKIQTKDRICINLIAIFISALISILLFFYLFKANYCNSLAYGIDLAKMMIGIWGTLLGFLISSLSVLLALTGGEHLNNLKETGHFRTILACYIFSCIHLLIAIVVFIVVIFINFWNLIFLTLLVFFYI